MFTFFMSLSGVFRHSASYVTNNRPFYQYSGHIYTELIQFKEYYRMPRGDEHISFVFLSTFWDISS